MLSASNNRASREGIQSSGPIAYQSFKDFSRKTIHQNTNFIQLSEPIGEEEISRAEIEQSGRKLTLLVHSFRIPILHRLKLKNCEFD